MDERLVQFRVGVMVLASLIIAGILVAIIGEFPTPFEEKYTVYISFNHAAGVSVDTPVRQSGILIGRVTDVELVEDAGALVTVEIKSKYKLKRNLICRISGSLLGDAILEFLPSGDTKGAKELIQDGDRLVGIARSDPLQVINNLEGSLADTITSVGNTSTQLGELSRRLSDLLDNNDDQISRIVSKTEKTIDRLRSAVESANDVLSDPKVKANLKRAVADLPEAISDARSVFRDFKTTLASVDRNLKNFEGLTKPLGERGGKLIGNLERATKNLDVVLSEFGTFSRRLNDSEGTLAQLVDDPELYQRILATVQNVEELSQDLKPIVRDARVFSDKLARFGLNGLFQRRSGIK